jgi:AcrR family transcriptional regulator
MIRIMKIDRKPPRPYDNSMRLEQAQATRRRILDAVIRVMASGTVDLSIPAVAREAGVSVPTVYRHFKTKQELVQALIDEVHQRVFAAAPHTARSPEELAELLPQVFALWGEMDSTLRAALWSELAYSMRRDALGSQRRELVEDALTELRPQLAPDEFAHLRDVLVLLCSSYGLRFFQDYLHLSTAEAAQTVVWAIHALTHSQPTRQEDRNA